MRCTCIWVLGKYTMLEAVNSVLSNASYTRAAAEQQSVVNSYAANPARVQQAPLQAPYISLYIKVDNNFDRAILQIRDNHTGDVVRQIPTESQLEAYRRAQTSNAVRARTAEDDVPVVIRKYQGGEANAAPVSNFHSTSSSLSPSSPSTTTSTPETQSTVSAAPTSVDTSA